MKVNKIIYIILALFLGGIGLHKFYAGRYFSGFLHLIFSFTFIPAVISFIHALLTMMFNVADNEGDIIV